MFRLETLSQTFTSYTALRRHYTCGFLFAYRGYDNASYRFGPQIQKQEEKLFQYARGLSVLWGQLSLTPCSPHLLLFFTSTDSVFVSICMGSGSSRHLICSSMSIRRPRGVTMKKMSQR